MAAILVYFQNGGDYGYNWTNLYQTAICPDFKCFHYSNVCYLDPHCNNFQIFYFVE